MDHIFIFLSNTTILWIYLAIINIITFIVFAVDKRKAVLHKNRVRESTLIILAMIGGAIGGLLAMRICRHKIRKRKFSVGLPLILAAHIAIIVLLIIYTPVYA